MNKREKILAAIVGSLMVLGVVFSVVQWATKTTRTRRSTIRALESEIGKKRRQVMFSRLAADRMAQYERRSLPRDPEVARSQYQTWLLKTVTENGIEDPDVTATTTRGTSDVYQQVSFTVSGRADLKQLVEFLYEFYATDCMHRIRRLHIKRIPDSRQLDLSITVDALAIVTAAEEKDMSEQTQERLPYGDLAAYWKIILGRNVSGPPNNPPQLEIADRYEAYAHEPFQFVARARDSDAFDSLRYFLEADSELDGASLDPRRGEFRWTPPEPGEYEFVVGVADDGWPEKATSKTVKLAVSERPPESPAPEERPDFELARFVYLTATTAANGVWQAWLNLRTEGKTLRLEEGDEFEVGDVTVRITRVAQDRVEMEVDALESRFEVAVGQNLADAAAASAL